MAEAQSGAMNDVSTSSMRRTTPTFRQVLGSNAKRAPNDGALVRSAVIGLAAGVIVWLLAASLGFQIVLWVV
jgi:hypothetical protein